MNRNEQIKISYEIFQRKSISLISYFMCMFVICIHMKVILRK